MISRYGGWAMLLGLALCSGCVDTGILRESHGRTVLKAFEEIATEAPKGVEQGLVSIKIETDQVKSTQRGMFNLAEA